MNREADKTIFYLHCNAFENLYVEHFPPDDRQHDRSGS